MKLKKQDIKRLVSEVIRSVILEAEEKTIEKLDGEMGMDDFEDIFGSNADDLKVTTPMDNPDEYDEDLDLSDAPDLATKASKMSSSRRNFLKGMLGTAAVAGAGLSMKAAMDKQSVGGISGSDLNDEIGDYISVFKDELGIRNYADFENHPDGAEIWDLGMDTQTGQGNKQLSITVKRAGDELLNQIKGKSLTLNQIGEIAFRILLPAIQHSLVKDVLPTIKDIGRGILLASVFYMEPGVSAHTNIFLEWCSGVIGDLLFGILIYPGKVKNIAHAIATGGPETTTQDVIKSIGIDSDTKRTILRTLSADTAAKNKRNLEIHSMSAEVRDLIINNTPSVETETNDWNKMHDGMYSQFGVVTTKTSTYTGRNGIELIHQETNSSVDGNKQHWAYAQTHHRTGNKKSIFQHSGDIKEIMKKPVPMTVSQYYNKYGIEEIHTAGLDGLISYDRENPMLSTMKITLDKNASTLAGGDFIDRIGAHMSSPVVREKIKAVIDKQ